MLKNAEKCWKMLRVRNNEKSWEILRKMMPGGFLKEDKRVRCSRKRDAKYSTHLSPEPVRKWGAKYSFLLLLTTNTTTRLEPWGWNSSSQGCWWVFRGLGKELNTTSSPFNHWHDLTIESFRPWKPLFLSLSLWGNEELNTPSSSSEFRVTNLTRSCPGLFLNSYFSKCIHSWVGRNPTNVLQAKGFDF